MLVNSATTITSHFLHAYVAKEGDEIRHSPRPCPYVLY
jgi:hypothetical protein